MLDELETAWHLAPMSRVKWHMSISIDGLVAGPRQSQDEPVGVGGLALHEWHCMRASPMPRMARPREMTSSVVTIWARMAGLR